MFGYHLSLKQLRTMMLASVLVAQNQWPPDKCECKVKDSDSWTTHNVDCIRSAMHIIYEDVSIFESEHKSKDDYY